MRLIDADKYKYGKIIDAVLNDYNFPVIKEINVSRIPTDFDVNEVIGKLSKLLSDANFEKSTKEVNESYYDGLAFAYADAINIIKKSFKN